MSSDCLDKANMLPCSDAGKVNAGILGQMTRAERCLCPPEGGKVEDTGVVRDIKLPRSPASMNDPLVGHHRGAAVRLEGRRGTLCVHPAPLQGRQIKLPDLQETERPLKPCCSRITRCMQVMASRALLCAAAEASTRAPAWPAHHRQPAQGRDADVVGRLLSRGAQCSMGL